MTAAGTPTRLNDDLLAELEKSATAYWSISDACAVLGINDRTWRRWNTQGKADQDEWEEAGTEGECDTLHARFARLASRVGAPRRRAICAGVLQSIVMNKNATDTDRIRAALGILKLDTAQRVEHTGADGGAIEVAAKQWVDKVQAMIEGAAVDPDDDAGDGG